MPLVSLRIVVKLRPAPARWSVVDRHCPQDFSRPTRLDESRLARPARFSDSNSRSNASRYRSNEDVFLPTLSRNFGARPSFFREIALVGLSVTPGQGPGLTTRELSPEDQKGA
jgi:hypothetical protein